MQSNAKNFEAKALETFANLMIERIETLQQDWKKPWFCEGSLSMPQNLSGRNYNGMNSIMLMMLCQKEGYSLPVFGTFDRFTALNFKNGKAGKREKVDRERVSINKGEHSFPVFITTFTVIDPETKEKIKYDDYKQMPQEERSKLVVYPRLQVYSVFNVDQTNLKEARPELYAELENKIKGQKRETTEVGEVLPVVDAMINQNKWLCPIKEQEGDDAYYSISKDEVVIPNRSQFKNIEAFQSNLFHEMAHSTGAESRLNRLKPSGFGSKEYASEELVAELTAAFVAASYGMTKNIKEDSAAYLKSWLHTMKETPEFIKSVLLDVKKAAYMITSHMNAVQVEMDIKSALNVE